MSDQLTSRKLSRHFFREWRKFRGMTQEAAAELLGMDRTNLSKIERGLVQYNQELLELASRAYRCSPSDLITHPPGDEPETNITDLYRALDLAKRKQAIRLLRALQDDESAAA